MRCAGLWATHPVFSGTVWKCAEDKSLKRAQNTLKQRRRACKSRIWFGASGRERKLECGRQFEQARENRVTSFEWVRGILMLIMNPLSAEIQLTAKLRPFNFFWVTLLGTFNRRCQQTAVFPGKNGHEKQCWLPTFGSICIFFFLNQRPLLGEIP